MVELILESDEIDYYFLDTLHLADIMYRDDVSLNVADILIIALLQIEL